VSSAFDIPEHRDGIYVLPITAIDGHHIDCRLISAWVMVVSTRSNYHAPPSIGNKFTL